MLYEVITRTLVDNGITPDRQFIIVDEDDNLIANGLSAAARMFSTTSIKPTALFAANDAMAIGCLQYLNVITSYSIHYTKLYENSLIFSCLSLWN